MKIKLVRFPYRDHDVGEVVDFGEEKNKSLVSLGRAVYLEEEKKKKTKTQTSETKKTKEDSTEKKEKSQGGDKKGLWERMV